MTQHINNIVEKENEYSEIQQFHAQGVHEIVVFHYLQELIHFELWGWISNHENHESTQYTICDKYGA